MTTSIIIILCSLLLIAYIFDLTSLKTKIPTVIPLLFLGWAARQVTWFYDVQIPDLTSLLTILGTIGLILIVLEGSLELELTRKKKALTVKSFIIALFPLLIMAFILSYLFYLFGTNTFQDNLINAIPLCVISSAIAIPSVNNFSKNDKEFVIYETSFSDIIGVILFNFIALNDAIDTSSIGLFLLQIGIIIVVSFVATFCLSYLLKKIDHHIKFIPILLLIVLIYASSKTFHLPALIFILFFGLFLGNLDKLKKFKLVQIIDPENLHIEVQRFKDILVEFTFLIRALFFLLFGFLIETSELFDTRSMVWAFAISTIIYMIRYITLKIMKLPVNPFLFVAPRGLITILLFLSIVPTQNISFVNKSLIIQVIIITVFIMMIGIIKSSKSIHKVTSNNNLKSSD